MVVPIKWLKGNMFKSSEQSARSRRQSTEEEVKVQKSLKKLFLPSWLLSKSNNSKVNKEIVLGEGPSAVWQASDSYKYLNLKDSPKNIEEKTESNGISEDTPGPSNLFRQKEDFMEKTRKEILSKPSCSRKEEFNVEIPIVTIENANVTYPRKSPCRKVENLNIVFPSSLEKEPLKLPEEFLQKTDPLKTIGYFPKERPDFYQDDNNQKQCCNKVVSSDIVTVHNDPPIVSKPPKRKTFKPRILTTPGGSRMAIFSSTLKNEEYSLYDSRQSSTTSIYSPNNYIDYQKQKLKDLKIKEKKLLALKDLISKKQELLYRLKEMRESAIRSPRKDLNNFPKESSFEEVDTDESWDNVFHSTRKSMELEKIVQNNTRHISKGLVRDLVNKFDCEEPTSIGKKTYQVCLNQTFVKMAANAMENGDTKEAQLILNERGTSTDEGIKIGYSSDYMKAAGSRPLKNDRSFNRNDVVPKLQINSKITTDEETKIRYSSDHMKAAVSRLLKNDRGFNRNDVVSKLPINSQISSDEETKIGYSSDYMKAAVSRPLKNDRGFNRNDVVPKLQINSKVNMDEETKIGCSSDYMKAAMSRSLKNDRGFNRNDVVSKLPINLQISSDEETQIGYSSDYMKAAMSRPLKNDKGFNRNDVVPKLQINSKVNTDEETKIGYSSDYMKAAMSRSLKNDRGFNPNDVVPKLQINSKVNTDEETKIGYSSDYMKAAMSRPLKNDRGFNRNDVESKLPINSQISSDEETQIGYSSDYMYVGMSRPLKSNRGFNRNDVVSKSETNSQISTDEETKIGYSSDYMYVGMSRPSKNNKGFNCNDVVPKLQTNSRISPKEEIKIGYPSDYMKADVSCPLKNNRASNSNDIVSKLSINSPMHFPNENVFSIPESIYPNNLKRRVRWIRVPPNVVCPSLYEKTFRKCRYSTARWYAINEPYITNSGYEE
uniref:Uncharacterized protein n=1 Tax=Vespula pensylvanica TaxID=30213 RepID=A0A834P7L1_VESPE|nr:hypothetical protein H0235_004481 [Vespula pensylvanica]